ncbi:pirin-like C-terminal cupin domain-containing protein [Pedobacter sp. JCM 36344]|uniref:pirin-like C-terminal cupin domain-containing protein n=1 Tax=Pedobacter sp. JCM 36344 TaxID=3374280 RepID=UPI00397C5992
MLNKSDRKYKHPVKKEKRLNINKFNARLYKGEKAVFTFPSNFNTGFVIIKGGIRINHKVIAGVDQFVHFSNEGSEIKIEALENSIILVLSGEPLNESIAQYGPFLMNNPVEIQQAIIDYNQGNLGYLEE